MTGQSRKQTETDESQGAPEWMVTFSDCMTLLLTFFVLLLSFSSFDQNVIWKLKLIFSNALPSLSLQTKEKGDAFLPSRQIYSAEKPDEGSEKATLAEGFEDHLKEDTEPLDFLSRKVFLIPSKEIFWGKGYSISAQGCYTMTTMASFLKEVPNRIVISENGPVTDKSDEKLGLQRAWAVMEYLTTEHGIKKKRFSIAGASTVAKEGFQSNRSARKTPKDERILEIVLLERSVCN